jgi:ectoine hydroxylase-related dioxygenase (phytanoyl-CoA dioxygenase family)
VIPPREILEQMLALRLHIDDCGPDNGPLRVLPGSHRHGRLAPDAILALRKSTPEKICTASAGDLLAMKPLLLHASSIATAPSHRRVIHIEFANSELPSPLRWFANDGTPSTARAPHVPRK